MGEAIHRPPKRQNDRYLKDIFEQNMEEIGILTKETIDMTTVELARKHGLEDGIEMGIERVAKNLFGLGAFSDLKISKVSGLPIERIIELRREEAVIKKTGIRVSDIDWRFLRYLPSKAAYFA